MNLKLFKKRLIALYSTWRKYKKGLWGNSDVLVISTPPASDSSENLCHRTSSSFFVWLLGHDFPDTIAIFARNEIYFLCTKKKFSTLQTLVGPAMEAVNAQVTVHPKSKGENGLELMDRIIRSIRVRQTAKADSDENQPLVVGYISGEFPKSNLFWGCLKNSKHKEIRSANVIGFSRLLNHDQDVRNSEKSAERRDSSKVDSGPDRTYIPIQSLPQRFEQMLSLSPEGRPEAPVILPEIAKTSKDGDRSCGEHTLVSDEEEEWVLVEADDKEQYMGERDKANVWMK